MNASHSARAVTFARPRRAAAAPKATSIFGRPVAPRSSKAAALARERGIDPKRLQLKPRPGARAAAPAAPTTTTRRRPR